MLVRHCFLSVLMYVAGHPSVVCVPGRNMHYKSLMAEHEDTEPQPGCIHDGTEFDSLKQRQPSSCVVLAIVSPFSATGFRTFSVHSLICFQKND